MTTPTTPDLAAIAEKWAKNHVLGDNPEAGLFAGPRTIKAIHELEVVLKRALTEATAPLQARIAFLERNVTPVNYIEAYHDVCKDREDILNGKPEWVQKLRAELTTLRADKERLDWIEKQPTLALWQGTFSDSNFNEQLHRVGSPICTISTMEPDGRESNDDEIGSGSSLRLAIDSAIQNEKGKE